MGLGGRKIAKLRKFDFDIVRRIAPDIIILELGSNDLFELSFRHRPLARSSKLWPVNCMGYPPCSL